MARGVIDPGADHLLTRECIGSVGAGHNPDRTPSRSQPRPRWSSRNPEDVSPGGGRTRIRIWVGEADGLQISGDNAVTGVNVSD